MRTRALITIFFVLNELTSFSQSNLDQRLLYKRRSNRYEGILEKAKQPSDLERTKDDFRIVGFTVGKFYFKGVKDEKMVVKRPVNAKIIAKNIPLDLRFDYRLEAGYEQNLYEVHWPVNDVLLYLTNVLTPKTVGVFGVSDGAYAPVYVENSNIKNDSIVRVCITPKSVVRNIEWRLLTKTQEELVKWTKIAQAPGKEDIRPGERVIIELPPLTLSAILEVRAEFREKKGYAWDDFHISMKDEH